MGQPEPVFYSYWDFCYGVYSVLFSSSSRHYI